VGAAVAATVSLLDHAALGRGHRARRGALMQPHTSSAPAAPPDESPRRRRVRRSALLCALIAAAFYLGFIVMTLVRGWK